MRITFVITELGMGGAEVQVCTLAAGLTGRGARVSIISMMSERAAHRQLADGSIAVSTLGMTRGRWSPGDLFRYVKLVRASRPDIVHAQMFHANLLARVGRPFVGAPLVCTAQNIVEGPEYAKTAGMRIRLRELAYRLTDPLSALTTQVSVEGAKRYVQVGAVPASKMLFVPNAIDCERFRPDPQMRRAAREELRLGEEFAWISVARMEEQKDPWTLLRAFHIAAKQMPSWVLLLAGAGSLDAAVRSYGAELGLASRVRFLGRRNDIASLLNAADGYVLSSKHEGLPMAVLEAAASALPVVATSAGAEVVRPHESGWVVPTQNAEALAERLCVLMALSPERRRSMGEAGRRFISSTYALPAVLDRWEEIYQRLVRRTGSTAT